MLMTNRDRDINRGWRNVAELEHELSARARAHHHEPMDWRLLQPLWRELAVAWGQKCRTALRTGADTEEVARCARYAMSYILDAEGARNWTEE